MGIFAGGFFGHRGGAGYGSDQQYGGFGGAPKFPQAMALDFLLRAYPPTDNASALAMAANPERLGAEIGMIAILHTWGQNPHS